MTRPRHRPVTLSEEVVAELASAAYAVALRHGLVAPFIDVELDLWRELRALLNPRPSLAEPDEVVSCPQ